MIDFHSHILPEMDDGSKSVQMSLEMLKKSKNDGVEEIVSTSHCYPREDGDFNSFLKNRKRAADILTEAMENDGGDFPKLHFGCELNLRCNVAMFRDIEKLCIGDTNYILVEMPFEPWTERMIECVYNLKAIGLKPIMAHIERFLGQEDSALNALFELDLLYQVNAESILNKKMDKRIRRLFDYGYIHVLGSDMHNMTTRKPNMKEAIRELQKKFGLDCAEKLCENARAILRDEPPKYNMIDIEPKKSLFTKIFQKS